MISLSRVASVSSFLLSAAALAVSATVVLLSPVAAHADTVYTLTATAVLNGAGGGTGSLSVDTQPTISGASSYSSGDDLDAFTLTLNDGSASRTFDLLNETATTTADFTDGNLSSLSYSGTSSGETLTISGLSYTFLIDNGAGEIRGSISGSEVGGVPTPPPPPTSATPEPSSLILLGTGILGVAGAARRRLLPCERCSWPPAA